MRSLKDIENTVGLHIIESGTDGFFGHVYFDYGKSKVMKVIFSYGEGWEHASMSFHDRCPDWGEMCRIKNMLWNKDETCIQYFPAEKDYVNLHPYCLHIWKPIGVEIPKPPKLMIGF